MRDLTYLNKYKYAGKKRKSQSNYTKNKKLAIYKTPGNVAPRSGLGNKASVTLIYSDRYTITGGSVGVPGRQDFRVNSFYDPDFTNVGHQPLGFDQLSPLYERYCVTQVVYKITFISGAATPGYVGLQINDTSVASTISMRNIIEQGQCEWGALGLSTGSGVKVFTGKIDCWKVMGQTYAEYVGDDTNSSTMSSSPNDNVWLSLFVNDYANSSGYGPIACNVELQMKGLMYGSKQTDES